SAAPASPAALSPAARVRAPRSFIAALRNIIESSKRSRPCGPARDLRPYNPIRRRADRGDPRNCLAVDAPIARLIPRGARRGALGCAAMTFDDVRACREKDGWPIDVVSDVVLRSRFRCGDRIYPVFVHLETEYATFAVIPFARLPSDEGGDLL